MRPARWLPLLAPLALLTGCESEGLVATEPVPPNQQPPAPVDPVVLTGRWEAFVDGAILDLQIFEEEDGTLSGSGHLRPRPTARAPMPPRSVALRIEGRFLFPQVSMTFRSTGFFDINFVGRVFGDHVIRGRLFGSSFEGDLVFLRRRDLRIDFAGMIHGAD